MDNHEFTVRFVANDNASRAKGLMFASPLDDGEAALFVFPYSDRHGFWNKNVSFRLSLAFLDENQKIVDIKDLEPQCTKLVTPDYSAKYVVEAKSGVFDKIGIKTGDFLIYDSNQNKLKSIKTS
jgi:uncharacterized membrane protein (UPF0127 family)